MTMLTAPMRDALRLIRAGKVAEATKLITVSLGGNEDANPAPIDVEFEIVDPRATEFRGEQSPVSELLLDSPNPQRESTAADSGRPSVARGGRPFARTPGESKRFEAGVYVHAAGSRTYKLWTPAAEVLARSRTPLIVMLHGCTQDADDFAIGTRMNELAARGGFHVLYPNQSASANFNRCWQWFRPEDQRRGSGEPAILADLTRGVVKEHAIDPARVFVAGLSAGAAMAVILGRTYPDVFAAVGSHSGLPYGCADNVPSAMAAMAGQARSTRVRVKSSPNRVAEPRPGIAIHGDRDSTVVPANSDALVAQWANAYADHGQRLGREVRTERGAECTRFATATGAVRIEQWTIPGAGHVWSGGDARGTHASAEGPDASQLMVDFFARIASAPCD